MSKQYQLKRYIIYNMLFVICYPPCLYDTIWSASADKISQCCHLVDQTWHGEHIYSLPVLHHSMHIMFSCHVTVITVICINEEREAKSHHLRVSFNAVCILRVSDLQKMPKSGDFAHVTFVARVTWLTVAVWLSLGIKWLG